MGLEVRDPDKLESIRQWTFDPCGSDGAEGAQPGSLDFFKHADHARYEVEQPWMDEAIGFPDYSGCRVLEVGYGMGGDLMRFARAGAVVSGIDLTPRHMELASKRFELEGVGADLRLGDAEDIPHPDASFDVVYTFGVIHHTPNTQRAVDEIHRVLRPGGTAIVAVYHRWSAAMASLMVRSLQRRQLFREPMRRTLSRIEYRANSDASPLVKVYSRRQLRRMLADFVDVRIDGRVLLHRPVPGWLPPRVTRRLEVANGWFLIAKCRKAGATSG